MMSHHLTVSSPEIIGQHGPDALHLPIRLLAALRSPESLPPSLTTFLFETQWVYWLILASTVAALLYASRTRKEKWLHNATIALAATLILWIIAAYLIDTPAERLYAAHAGLARAARDGDTDRILTYLADDFISPSLGVTRTDLARNQLSVRLKVYGVHASTITAYRSDISGKTAFTTLSLVTQSELAGLTQSTWNLSWDDVPNADWKIKEADLIKLNDQSLPTDWVLPKFP